MMLNHSIQIEKRFLNTCRRLRTNPSPSWVANRRMPFYGPRSPPFGSGCPTKGVTSMHSIQRLFPAEWKIASSMRFERTTAKMLDSSDRVTVRGSGCWRFMDVARGHVAIVSFCNLRENPDNNHGQQRTEVSVARFHRLHHCTK